MNATTMVGPTGSASAATSYGQSGNSTIAPVLRDLAELAALIERLDDASYQLKPVGLFSSSVGEHLRHCLDHIDALLRAIDSNRICYDNRRRGTNVETSRSAALSTIDDLRARARSLSNPDLNRSLILTALLSKSGPTLDVETSLGRELLFVVSHTTHHNAIIGAMAKTLGASIPDDFGVAASTSAFREETRCAP